jgi:hypothetical protein
VRGDEKSRWVRSRPAQSSQALTVIAQNIDLAADCEGAICQDTGIPTFEVKTPVGVNQIVLKKQIRDAIAEATKRGKLRPNSVDSLTGENSGNNLGPGTPIIHFEQWENDDEIEVKLIPEAAAAKHERAVLAPHRAARPRSRRPVHRRCAQVHPPRRVECARQGVCTGSDWRLRRW